MIFLLGPYVFTVPGEDVTVSFFSEAPACSAKSFPTGLASDFSSKHPRRARHVPISSERADRRAVREFEGLVLQESGRHRVGWSAARGRRGHPENFETALTALYPPHVVIWASDPCGQSIPKELAARNQPCSFHGLWLSQAHQIANEPADLNESQCESLLPAWMVPLVENVVAREYARHGAFFENEEDYCRAAARLVGTLPDLSYCNYLVARHHEDGAFIQEMGMSHAPDECNLQGVSDPKHVKDWFLAGKKFSTLKYDEDSKSFSFQRCELFMLCHAEVIPDSLPVFPYDRSKPSFAFIVVGRPFLEEAHHLARKCFPELEFLQYGRFLENRASGISFLASSSENVLASVAEARMRGKLPFVLVSEGPQEVSQVSLQAFTITTALADLKDEMEADFRSVTQMKRRFRLGQDSNEERIMIMVNGSWEPRRYSELTKEFEGLEICPDINRGKVLRQIEALKKCLMSKNPITMALVPPFVFGTLVPIPVNEENRFRPDKVLETWSKSQQEIFNGCHGNLSVYGVFAAVGTGKTTLLATVIGSFSKHMRRTVYAAPTRDLAAEFSAKLTEMGLTHCNVLEEQPDQTSMVFLTTVDSVHRIKTPVREAFLCEAGQTTCLQVLTTLNSLPKLRRLVLVGDPKQLGPVRLASKVLRTTVLAGALTVLEALSFPMAFLSTQFRVPKDLCRFLSARVYGGRLESGSKCRDELKLHVRIIKEAEEERRGTSWISELEKVWVGKRIDEIRGMGCTDVVVLCFYEAQKQLLAESFPYVKVETVDSCQGTTHQAVVLCTTRYAPGAFLRSSARTSVALSRCTEAMAVSASVSWLFASPAGRALADLLLSRGQGTEQLKNLPPLEVEKLIGKCLDLQNVAPLLSKEEFVKGGRLSGTFNIRMPS